MVVIFSGRIEEINQAHGKNIISWPRFELDTFNLQSRVNSHSTVSFSNNNNNNNNNNAMLSTTFLFIHKATCFDPSVGHLQAYIAD